MLHVYARRNKDQERTEYETHPEQGEESKPNSRTHEITQGNSHFELAHTDPSVNDLDHPTAVRKGIRSCTNYPIYNFVSYEGLSPRFRTFVAKFNELQIPNTVHEALKVPEWRAAVWGEIQAPEKNGSWKITDLPTGKCPIGNKWIFTIKHMVDGSVERFRARLVAKSFTQSYRINYQEIFALVAKLTTIRLLSLDANLDRMPSSKEI